ncbi:MAG: hypothetical protein Q7N95_03275 [Alphaproteobacteria bacterium]|nr:hypothetical protein [Alphaproteobacteria bacterium]
MLQPQRCIVGAIAALILLGLVSHTSLAQETDAVAAGSLLFSATEKRAIEGALALRPFESARTARDGSVEQLQIPEDEPSWQIERLHLSALIYYDPQKWTLWFGKRQVRQNAAPPYLVDLRVTANYVDLGVIPRPGARPIPVRLRPNQTFLIGQLRITEGGGTEN